VGVQRDRQPCANINRGVFVAESRTQAALSYRPIRAPRGLQLSCKGWQQESALRLLMNSADPAIAEHPQELIVSGGIGKLARDWQAFHAIEESLRALHNDETLVLQDGAPGTILKTNPEVPRVLLVNPLVPSSGNARSSTGKGQTQQPPARMAADWMFTGPASALPEACQVFRAAARKHFGGSLAGRLVVAAGMGGMGGAQALAVTLNGGAFLGIDADIAAIKRRVKGGYCEVMVNNLDEALRILKNAVRKREPASVGLIGNVAEVLPEFVRRGVLPDLLTDETPADDPSSYIPQALTVAQAAELREQDPHACRERALDSIAAQVRAMLELRKMGAVVFEFGNGIRAQASARGVAGSDAIPDFISEYLHPDLEQGCGLVTFVALSGDSGDIGRVDNLFSSLFPGSELQRWIPIARRHPSPGLPARSCWISADDASKLGAAINDLVARGEINAPVAMGRSIRQSRSWNLLGSQAPAQSADSSAGGQALGDSPEFAALLDAARGAAWLSVHASTGADECRGRTAAFAVLDGSPKTSERIERVFSNHFMSRQSGAQQ
jgi:urocanate hydratase